MRAEIFALVGLGIVFIVTVIACVVTRKDKYARLADLGAPDLGAADSRYDLDVGHIALYKSLGDELQHKYAADQRYRQRVRANVISQRSIASYQ